MTMASYFGYGTMNPSEADENPAYRTVKVNMDSGLEFIERERCKIRFGTNSVSTAKYTAFSFLPM